MTHFTCRETTLTDHKTDCLILCYFSDFPCTTTHPTLSSEQIDHIQYLQQHNDLPERCGDVRLSLQAFANSQRMLLLCLGNSDSCGISEIQTTLSHAWKILRKTGARDAAVALPHNTGIDLPISAWVRFITESYHYHHYCYLSTQTTEEDPLNALDFIACPAATVSAAQQQLHYAQVIGRAVNDARKLGDRPPNQCTPTDLATQAQQIARQHQSVTAEVLDEATLHELGLHALLSIGQGSREPSHLIVLRYQGHPNAAEPPYAFIGKGVTFDTGGISLKTRVGMRDMKMDMCGAATVLSAFQAAAELALPINLVTLVPTVENMPGGHAVKVSDVVTSLSGKTIEILNTDAEGRVILCDAITYSQSFNPKVVIDVATLTGAIGIALGHSRSGLFANQAELSQALMQAGEESYDIAWPMPLDKVYRQALKSTVADLKNISEKPQAGAITAATFLSCFADELNWAHLDIAGTASDQHNSTGRGTALLVQYLINEVSETITDAG